MKAICSIVACLFCLAISVQAQSGTGKHLGDGLEKLNVEPTADYIAIYQEAVKSFNGGNYNEAQQQVDLVLSKYPHYKPAVNLQSRVTAARRTDRSEEMRRRLDRIIIPRVNFRDALVENACDFLRDESRRLDPEKKGVSVVLNVPDHVKKKKISLDLVDVSAGDLLKYITEVAGLKYRVDRSVVMITSDEPAKAPSESTAASDASQSLLPVIPNAGP